MEYSKTFCIYPWMHQMTTPTGKVNFCCISNRTAVTDDEGKIISLGKHSFASAWNTKYMRQIRKNMIEGLPVTGCETCYKQEEIGKKSYRQTHNEDWLKRLGSEEFSSRVEDSITSDFAVAKLPVYLDLRLGNLCNLKCRMCNPYNSIMIEKEWRELDQETEGQYSKFWGKHHSQNGSIDKWYESEFFWKDIENYIPFLQKVYMTGGEPTLIEANYKFLDKCKEMGYAHQIELFFNLNFTTLKDRFIEQLKYFKWTSINASLDGFATDNEYIRGNSNWGICSGNISKLLDKAPHNVGLGFSPVIQTYNILTIDKLLDYVEELILKYDKDMLVDFLFCFNPSFLDFVHLPASIKLEAKKNIINWTLRSKTYARQTQNSFFLKNGIESLINRIDQTMDLVNPEMLKSFMYYTDVLDNKRNQSFEKSFPQLREMLREAGY